MLAISLSFAFFAVTSVLAHPHPAIHNLFELEHDTALLRRQLASPERIARRDELSRFPELQALLDGNERFATGLSPEQLDAQLAGQSPPALFIGCSDSRVSENQITSAPPGTLFTVRNIANQYNASALTTESALAYGVNHLHVKHIIVTGHIGCGGIAASMSPRPAEELHEGETALHDYLDPLREVFANSTHEDVVAYRDSQEKPQLTLDHPAFVAMVHENVARNVHRVVESSVVQSAWSHFATGAKGHSGEPTPELWVHGMVYDLRTGLLENLGISQGPPAPSSHSEREDKCDKDKSDDEDDSKNHH